MEFISENWPELLLALITLLLKSVLEWKQAREFAQAQGAPPEPHH